MLRDISARELVNKLSAAFACCMLLAEPVLSCTLCRTETAQAIRTTVLNERFLLTLGEAILPFVIVGAVAAGVHGRRR